MEALPSDSGLFVESDRKRESRLKNIIDQLRSSRVAHRVDDCDLSASSNGNPDNETSVPHVSLAKAQLSPSATNKARRKKGGIIRTVSAAPPSVKNERCSPVPSSAANDMGTESSRSDSPNSPSGSFRPQSFASNRTTPPNASFTPPDRFSSPGQNNNKLVMEGLHMSRNYSDFMRSLAAKYNNSQPESVRSASNNFNIPLLDSRFSSYGKGSSFPQLLGNLPLASSTKKDLAETLAAAGSKSKDQSGLLMPPLSLQNHLPGFPMMMDMSSTQALLNIVRSASAQNAQQLESYLRGAAQQVPVTPPSTKRSAEVAGLMSSPLDLSASVLNKRPYMEPRTSLKSPPQHSPAGKLSPPSARSTPTIGMRRVTTPKVQSTASLPMTCRLACAADACTPAALQVRGWSVSDVVDFVKTIDLCAEYAQAFKEHSIDGSTLPLLTEDHLTSTMNMKLGPALKLRSVLAAKIGHCAVCLHCVHCHHNNADPAPPASSPPASASPTSDQNQSLAE